MRKCLGLLGGAAVVALAAWTLRAGSEDRGRAEYFADRTYNFETVRVMNDIAVAGGDINEAAQAVPSIKSGDAGSWYEAWLAAGDRTAALASGTADLKTKGDALLRAHTYYRSAEFFLLPDDKRRPQIWKKNVDAFYTGLDTLGVAYERIQVPYGQYHLNAIYYRGLPGSEIRPLLMVVGGYDSTLEELYLGIAAAALRHGYAVLTYEGPGQGSVLREQGLVMQPDWEKPNGAVLDAFLAAHPKPAKIVLLGESLGGYLAPRAAAFEPRIDGVVAYDVFFDANAITARSVPQWVVWLHRHGYDRLLNFVFEKMANPGQKWSTDNGQWVFGVHGRIAVFDAFKPYKLEPVAAEIRGDVLILAGAEDHFVPVEQLTRFQKSLINARSVTAKLFDQASGAALHCQLGAPSVWQAFLFDWLAAKFPAGLPQHT